MFSRLLAIAGIALAMANAPLTAADQVLRIGYQKSGAFLLVKAEGGLEKRLAPLGWTVAWTEFSAGVPLIEGLDTGSLDIGHSGDAPAVFAQAAAKRLVYVARSEASPASVGLIVPAGSTVASVAELKGRKIAVAKGSSGHYFLLKALAEAGIKPAEVTFAWLNPPDGRPAFEHGSIDAWAVWDPFLAGAEVQIKARLLRDGAGLTPFREFYLASPAFAKERPEIVAAVLAELEEVGARAKQDPDKIASFLAGQLKIDLPILQRSELRKFRYGAKPLDAAVVAEQQAIADLFLANGLITTAFRVGDLIPHTATAPGAAP